MPEISVIVPVYNVEKYLHRCVDSILAQTFTDFELILVDDGSPDNCGAICDEYAQKDSRVWVIHKSNGGVSDARNAALDVVRGEYIAFCDGDDYWRSDYLEIALNAFIDDTVDSIVMDYMHVDENDERISEVRHRTGTVEYKEETEKYEYILEYLLKGKHGWEIWTRIFKTEIIQKNHIRFCLECGNYAEDLAFVAEYVLCSQTVNSISERLYYYRIRSGSMMQKSKQCVKLDQVNQVSYQIYNRYMNTISDEEYRRRYAVLHFLILYIELKKMIWSDSYCELGRAFDEIRDCNWSRHVLRDLHKCRSYLLEYYGKRVSAQILLFIHYCIHGNWKRFRYESAVAYRWFIEKE